MAHDDDDDDDSTKYLHLHEKFEYIFLLVVKEFCPESWNVDDNFSYSMPMASKWRKRIFAHIAKGIRSNGYFNKSE